MDPLKVSGFGAAGVNVVDSPIHLDDNDLQRGQNAEVYFEDGYPGIRKRLGLDPLNAEPLAGAVLAFTCIPLPDPAPALPPTGPALADAGFIVFTQDTVGEDAVAAALTSEDGSTWTLAVIGPLAAPIEAGFPVRYPRIGPASYYLAAPTPLGDGLRDDIAIYRFDGAETILCPLPVEVLGAFNNLPCRCLSATTDGTNLYFLIGYNDEGPGTPDYVRIWKVDPSGVKTKVGEAFGSADQAGPPCRVDEDRPLGIVWWQGRLWTAARVLGSFDGVENRFGVRTLSIDPTSETTWQDENTFGGTSATNSYESARIDAAGENLFVFASPQFSFTGIDTPYAVRRRTSGGAWTTIDTGPAPVDTRVEIVYPVWVDEGQVIFAVAVNDSVGPTNSARLRRSTTFTSCTALATYPTVVEPYNAPEFTQAFAYAGALCFVRNNPTFQIDQLAALGSGALTTVYVAPDTLPYVSGLASLPAGAV